MFANYIGYDTEDKLYISFIGEIKDEILYSFLATNPFLKTQRTELAYEYHISPGIVCGLSTQPFKECTYNAI